MRRESFVCTSKIIASFNQWSVILILCLQFQRLVCTLSFRSLKNTVALANVKCHTLRSDKLRPKCFKTSKVIIAKCFNFKTHSTHLLPRDEGPIPESHHGRQARLFFRGLLNIEAPKAAGYQSGPPGFCLSGWPRPIIGMNRAEGALLLHGNPELPVLNERTSRSPPVRSKLCEELLVPGPLLQAVPEMLPRRP